MTFFFDEQLPPAIVTALGETEQAAKHVVHEGLRGKSDEEVIQYAGARGWFFVTSNTDILRKPQERAAIIQHGVGAFFFTGRANRDRFDWLQLIVNRWKDMQAFAESTPKPFTAQVPDRGAIKLISNRRIRRPRS